ncbi:MAG: deoxyribose-phosphate aldolase [Thermoflavifilum aggregans]|nr:deoxyribose-phosphate aldolase [Thermoflavifilum aggregans]
MSSASVASYIDHTLLKSTAKAADIDRLCEEAMQYGFAAVCVPPCYVTRAWQHLQGSHVKVATVVGFPLGYATIETKLAEAKQAMGEGADELDMVINLSALFSGDEAYLRREIETILPVVHAGSKILKLIIESGILSEDQIRFCCTLYGNYPVDFLKTSTGFAEKGASLEAVKLMRSLLPENIRIKASGGIRHYAQVRQYLEAGATRIGCSAGVAIMQEAVQQV